MMKIVKMAAPRSSKSPRMTAKTDAGSNARSHRCADTRILCAARCLPQFHFPNLASGDGPFSRLGCDDNSVG